MSVKIKKFFCTILLCSIWAPSIFATQQTILPIKQWTTKSGTPVFFVREPELPIIDIQVIFDAGSARDGSKPGLARITNETLIAGTQTMNADDLAAAFDNVGAIYSTAVNRDMSVVALRSLVDPKFFQPAFKTFSDVLSHPIFPEKEFLRIQKQILNALNQQEELPASIATKAFYNAVYDDNPYGHPILGTTASVSKLIAKDLKEFYNKNYNAQNALIAMVGDIELPKAQQLAEDLSAQLNKGQKLAKLEMKPINYRLVNQHISFPSSQTNILIGQLGITRNDPTYFPVIVGNYILGGGALTSRLFDEVREKRGLAYAVRSQFSALKEKGPFMVELQTRNTESDHAIKVVTKTLLNFVSQGPTNAELTSAKKNLTQGFILRLASNSAIVSQLVNIGYYQLPLNYLDTYKDNVSTVTNQQIKTAFQQIIRPKQFVTITVGNSR